jgi:hypothetical protein
MCLHSLKEKPIGFKNRGFGYKVVRKDNRCSVYGQYKLSKRWSKSTDGLIYYNYEHSYETGFYVFVSKEDADLYCIPARGEIVIKVKCKKIVCVGTQEFELDNKTLSANVIVARSITRIE